MDGLAEPEPADEARRPAAADMTVVHGDAIVHGSEPVLGRYPIGEAAAPMRRPCREGERRTRTDSHRADHRRTGQHQSQSTCCPACSPHRPSFRRALRVAAMVPAGSANPNRAGTPMRGPGTVNVTAGGRRALSGLRNGKTDETVRGTDSCGRDDGDAGRRLAGGRAGANPEMPDIRPSTRVPAWAIQARGISCAAVRPLVRASMWPCANSGCRLAGGWRCTLSFNVPPRLSCSPRARCSGRREHYERPTRRFVRSSPRRSRTPRQTVSP
jgi:hypothetical protein